VSARADHGSADRTRAGRLWGTVGLKLGPAHRDAAKSLIEMVVGEYVMLHNAAPWRRSHLSTDGQRAEVAFEVYI
jgi:hypothetical protein